MDLFDYMREQNMEKEAPLASRLRPTTLDEVVGQKHIIGKDKLLYRAIKADKLSSVIFYGPPGTGKCFFDEDPFLIFFFFFFDEVFFLTLQPNVPSESPSVRYSP